METKKIEVKGMSCGHCVKAVEKEIAKLNLGKSEVQIGSVEVTIGENYSSLADVENAIKEAGFEVVSIN